MLFLQINIIILYISICNYIQIKIKENMQHKVFFLSSISNKYCIFNKIFGCRSRVSLFSNSLNKYSSETYRHAKHPGSASLNVQKIGRNLNILIFLICRNVDLKICWQKGFKLFACLEPRFYFILIQPNSKQLLTRHIFVSRAGFLGNERTKSAFELQNTE